MACSRDHVLLAGSKEGEATARSDENQSEFKAMIERFEGQVDEIELEHRVGALVVKRTLRLKKAGGL